jgi:ATP-dependent 26S proteasome regulatory subunit
MSSPDDLEGDDIWGDGTAGKAATTGATTSNESKQEENDENNNATADDAEMNMEDEETRHMSISEIRQRIHLLSSDVRVMKSDVQRITHESRGQRERIRENLEKVKVNKQLPYLVANVVEILEPDAEDGKFHIF